MQSAEKQGNQLHMNVYKMKGQACGGPLKTEVKELKGDLRPAPPYPSRVKTVDKGTQVTPEREAVSNSTLTPNFLLPIDSHMCSVFEIILIKSMPQVSYVFVSVGEKVCASLLKAKISDFVT